MPEPTPTPERQFLASLRRHPEFGVPFVIGFVLLLAYAGYRIGAWAGWGW